MKFGCPHCHQRIDAGEEWAGRTTDCPACGQNFKVPSAVQRRTVAGRSGSGFSWVILIVLLVAASALGYALVCYKESPAQLWTRLMVIILGAPTPAPQASAPIVAAVPMVTPASVAKPLPSPAATPEPTPQIIATAIPEATSDPVAYLIAHPDAWPKQVTLLAPTQFEIVHDGASAGSIDAGLGTQLQVMGIEPGYIDVTLGEASKRLPISATDLAARGAQAVRAYQVRLSAEASITAARQAATAAQSASLAALASEPATGGSGGFVHPGLLHNDADFDRMRRNIGREPWKSGWQMLIQNPHASLGYHPRPTETVVRGNVTWAHQNYPVLFNDAAAAYACALRWRISGDPRYADKSIEILNAWGAALKGITGSSDAALAGGIYGFEMANAAEIMRTYHGWKPEDFARFQKMMMDVFYPINRDFLAHHFGRKIDHYWANWDLCNMDSMLAIGVLCDRRDIYEEAIRYFKTGGGNGAIKNTVWYLHPGGFGQWQEAGRDQGHTMMGIGLLGAFCEMAWKQGEDLYSYDDNRFLKGCEYVAKYNLGEDVPYQPYANSDVRQEVISAGSRGQLRPVWELVYNHYVLLKGLAAPYTTQMAAKVRPEGGGGNYGPNSGGFDQLGYGTLTATLEREADGAGGNPLQ